MSYMAEVKTVFAELMEKPIDQIDIATASQQELERLYSNHQLLPTIRQEFIEAGFEEQLQKDGIDPDLGLTVLVQISLHKRCTVDVMVGLMRKQVGSLQEAADTIYKMCELDYLDTETVISSFDESHRQMLVVSYDVCEETQKKLDQFQYPLPMIEKPETITNNRQTGYQTIKGSLILKDNHHDDDICLDHINRLNQVALSLDPDVVSFIQNQWKNLDKRKPGETIEDYRKRVKAFEKYDRSARDVIAGLMASGDRFWITHRYDKRGRTYCAGYHVNYQSTDWCKAVVKFAHGEKLNDE